MDNSLKTSVVGILGAGIGFAIGYKIAEKKLAVRFEERLTEETKGMREFYTNVKKPYATPEAAVKDLIPEPAPEDPRVKKQNTQYNKLIKEEKYVSPETVIAGESGVVIQNVFDMGPVVIDQDEFMTNELGHEQATLTYYEKSDQVCGERDEPIDNSEIVVGTAFKTHFGDGSSDENVVHIRNSGLHMDFEVVRSFGSYEAEVLGMTDDSVPPHKRVRLEGR
jgi:hypothetical protein